MARYQKVVEVDELSFDEEGNQLDTEGEIIDSDRIKVQEPGYEKVKYYLLHWGLTYEILVDQNQRYPIAYTVAICQRFGTGEIKSFVPQDLTVIGKEKQV